MSIQNDHPVYVNEQFISRTALFGICIFIVVQSIDYINFSVDDVFISLKYAQNFASGKGLGYNAGETIEGYSNPLWVLLMATPLFLNIISLDSGDSLMWFSKAMSFSLFIASLFVMFKLIVLVLRRDQHHKTTALISVSLLTSCAPLLAWSVSGLETTMCMLIYTLMALMMYRIISQTEPMSYNFTQYLYLGCLMGICIMVRPETPLYILTVLIMMTRYRHTRKYLLLYALPALLIIGAGFYIWRWLTFSELVPNTFYAKTNVGVRGYVLGIKYFAGGIGIVFGMFVLLVAYFMFFSKDRPIRDLVFAFAIPTVIFILISGGDWMPAYRFFIPVVPVLFLAVITGYLQIIHYIERESAISKIPRLQFVIFYFLVLSANAFGGRMVIRNQISALESGFSSIIGHCCPAHKDVVEWLAKHSTGPITVATGEAGYIGYNTPTMYLIDLGLLNNAYLAKRNFNWKPFDADYVLRKKPDYIIAYHVDSIDMSQVSKPKGDYIHTILAHNSFRSSYYLAHKTRYLDIWSHNSLMTSK